MSGQMAVNVLIGATLAGGFGSAVGSAMGQLTSLAAAGALIGRAVSGAMDFEHTLTRTALTAEMTRDETEKLRHTLRGLSLPSETNLGVESLEKGFNTLVSAGMEATRAGDTLKSLGRTATATGADITDLSKTAFVLTDTLGIAPGALTAELDALAYAGKAGAFELSDMAKYFPMLGAGARDLGLKGTEGVRTLAAALQIAKRGAGSPEEAARNMQNFLAKLTAPDTLKKAKKAGIDIQKIIKKSMQEGENPMDAVLDAIQKKTKGDPFKLGKIFGDMQVQNFLKPMLADLEDYKQLKADIASKSMGTVDADYARMLETTKEQAAGLSNALDKAGDNLGRLFTKDAGTLIGQLTTLVGVADAFISTNPEQAKMVVYIGASIAAFKMLGIAGRMAGRGIAAGSRTGGGALGALRRDFATTLAASNRLAASQPTLAARFRAAGGASGILRSRLTALRTGAATTRARIMGLGTTVGSLPARFRAAGGAAGVMRAGLTGLRVGLVGTRVGVRALGMALKGLFMTNPLGWLFAAVELGALLYDSWKPFREMVDALWGGLKKVGSALAEFFGIGSDPEEDTPNPATTPEEDEEAAIRREEENAEKAERQRVKADLDATRKSMQPGAGVAQATQPVAVQPGAGVAQATANTAALASGQGGAGVALAPQPPQEHKFSHNVELTINAPAGFTAQATAAPGSGVSISTKTGRIMAGVN